MRKATSRPEQAEQLKNKLQNEEVKDVMVLVGAVRILFTDGSMVDINAFEGIVGVEFHE